MKKIFYYSVVLLLTILLLLAVNPAYAELRLTELRINEEIIAGPVDVYLTATGILSNGNTQQIKEGLIWTSSNLNVATIGQNGKLHFTGKGGTVTISVFKGNASGRKTILVKPWPGSIEIETTLTYSENPYRLMAKGVFSDGQTRYFGPDDQITWSSSNPLIAWVNSHGIVTFTGQEGYVVITATSGEEVAMISTLVATGKDFSVYNKAIKIKERVKYSAEPQKIKLVLEKSDGTEQEVPGFAADWISTDPLVAKINQEGEVSFSGKPGVAIIKAFYGGFHCETSVEVGRFIERISINQSLNYTSSWENIDVQLTATAYYNDGTQYEHSGLDWGTDNEKVAAVSNNGVLRFSGSPGLVKIIVSAKGIDGENVSDEVIVTVPDYKRPQPLKLYIEDNLINLSKPLEPVVNCIFDDGTCRDITSQVEWSTPNTDKVSIFEGKIYISPEPGIVTIKADYKGLSDTLRTYVHKSAPGQERIRQIRIKEHSLCYSKKPIALTAGAVLADGTIKDVTKQLRWKSTQPEIIKIANGVVTFTGRPGKTKIIAEGFGFRDLIEVEVFPQEIKTHLLKLVIQGELSKGANQLKLIAYYNDGKQEDVTNSAVWNTSNKNIALVTEKGLVMFNKELKTVRITAYFQGQETFIERK